MSVNASIAAGTLSAHTTPISVAPVKTGLVGRLIDWIKSFFVNKEPISKSVVREAKDIEQKHALIGTRLADRPATLIMAVMDPPPTLLAKALQLSVDPMTVIMKADGETQVTIVKQGDELMATTPQPIAPHCAILSTGEPVDAGVILVSRKTEVAAGVPAGVEAPANEASLAAKVSTSVAEPFVATTESSAVIQGHAEITDYLKWMQAAPGHANATVEDLAAGEPRDTAALDGPHFRKFLGTTDLADAAPAAAPPTVSDDPQISQFLKGMQADPRYNAKDPVYDARSANPAAYPSQKPISSSATDRQLVKTYLQNVLHSLGNGSTRYLPDVKGAINNITTRLGTGIEAMGRADVARQLTAALPLQQLAPIGLNATFNVSRNGNAFQTISKFTLPQDKQLNTRMQNALDQNSEDLETVGGYYIATPFAAQISGSTKLALTIEPPKTSWTDRALALGNAKKLPLDALFDACYQDQLMMAEVSRHLNPDGIHRAISESFGIGTQTINIDGVRLELAQEVPTCSYVVKSASTLINGKPVNVVNVTIEARWDIDSFSGTSSERRRPIGDMESTFTAIVNFPIIPIIDANGDVTPTPGAVTLSASTSIGNSIEFSEDGHRA